MHNILEKIIEKKRTDLSEIKKHKGLFKEKILSAQKIMLIAEIKFASPTISSLGSPNDLIKRAKEYEKAGADAISLITEKHFFKGDSAFVSQVKQQIKSPILQKDFVIDEYQIYEAKQNGADAVLLIARLLTTNILKQFVLLCQELGIESIIEINSEKDLQKALSTKTAIIAVNARNLETFVIDKNEACRLLKKIPDTFIKLGFSGIASAADVLQYKNAGAKGVLIGTSLMKTKNITQFIGGLRDKC